jgi:hypothetical protein
MAAGRSPESRTVASVGTTNLQPTITAPAGSFREEDVGRPITGTGIPASTTVLSVQSDTGATMSANATATGSITATLGGNRADQYGFRGWSPETDAESEVYAMSAGNGPGVDDPQRLANAFTERPAQRARG